METPILEFLKSIPSENLKNYCLVTLVESKGSTPRPQGCSMIIGHKGPVIGSVGGGCVEGTVITLALEALTNRKTSFHTEILNDELSGHICGGKVRFFIEPLN